MDESWIRALLRNANSRIAMPGSGARTTYTSAWRDVFILLANESDRRASQPLHRSWLCNHGNSCPFHQVIQLRFGDKKWRTQLIFRCIIGYGSVEPCGWNNKDNRTTLMYDVCCSCRVIGGFASYYSSEVRTTVDNDVWVGCTHDCSDLSHTQYDVFYSSHLVSSRYNQSKKLEGNRHSHAFDTFFVALYCNWLEPNMLFGFMPCPKFRPSSLDFLICVKSAQNVGRWESTSTACTQGAPFYHCTPTRITLFLPTVLNRGFPIVHKSSTQQHNQTHS